MFRIGEFSKIAQVSGSQLRYYDEIGLLNPARIDELTGYRYYSARQLPLLNRILALKDLGLSLDQIRRMLDEDVSSDEIRGMYTLKKAQIEQTVGEQLTRLQNIESRLSQIDEGELPGDSEIILKSIPEQPYLSLREIVPSFDVARMTMMEMQRTLPTTIQRKSMGYFTAILHNETYENEDIDLEMGFVIAEPINTTITLPSQRMMSLRFLPAVETMATAIGIGMPQTIHLYRGALAMWVETNGYEFSGNGREVFIAPPQVGREHETVIEIQYPIVKREQANLLLP